MKKQLLEQILENQKILLAENQQLTDKLKAIEYATQIIQSMLTEPMELTGTARRNLSKFGGFVVASDLQYQLKKEAENF
jgi:hypothetical protein